MWRIHDGSSDHYFRTETLAMHKHVWQQLQYEMCYNNVAFMLIEVALGDRVCKYLIKILWLDGWGGHIGNV